ncbi:MAG: hypothetical protein KGH96_23225 [Sphingomonadales bacterium]|nr:hypothetical protein [Sphingomonadales bacterium]
MNQIAIDFAAARAARDAGMTQAIQHAERVDDEWPDAALDFLYRYARTHVQFISEEATAEAARLGLASPADPRAWGAIFKRAASAANGSMPFIQKVGYGISQRRHLSPTPLWRSLVFAGSAA